ncbi:MAG: hypothetical protein AB1630_05005 [bacterium]
MKNKIQRFKGLKIWCSGALVLVGCSTSAFAIEFNPYYNYTLSQGYNFGSGISSSFGSGITNDLGCQIKLGKKDSLLLLYEASYEGPGLKEEGKFTDRYQDHLLVASYKRKFNKMLLKAKIDYTKSFTRSGVSEDWDSGDYNYNKLGFGLDLLSSLKGINLGMGGKVANVKYPNYTYLLGEIDPEYDIPRYDHNLYKISLSGGYLIQKKLPFETSFELLLRNYKNELIKDINSGKDTAEKEKDRVISLNGNLSYPLKENLNLGMDSSFSFLRSNYNEVKFNATGTALSDSCASFYNYNIYCFAPWISYLRKNLKFNLSYSLEMKNFSNQKAEDKDGKWLSDKRKDRTSLVLISATKKINKQVSATISYGIKALSSNMEKTGYNTTYNSLGFNLQFEY